MQNNFIDVLFDGPPGPIAGRFVEVENAEGKSIAAGEWLARGDGLWALRIGVNADPKLIATATELVGALIHIQEYWNGSENERAMTDALNHIVETAQAAITKASA